MAVLTTGAAVLKAAKFVLPWVLPWLLERAGGALDAKMSKPTIIKTGETTRTVIPGKGSKLGKGMKGLGKLGVDTLMFLGPSLLSGLSTAAKGAGDTAGDAVNAVAMAPAAFVSGMASPQQQAAHGVTMLQPIANVAALAGNVGKTAATSVGNTVSNIVGGIGDTMQATMNTRRMMDFLERQSANMKANPMSSAQYDLLGRTMSNMPQAGRRPSDENVKEIFTPERVKELLAMIGKDKDFNEEAAIDDTVLQGYADHIHNYLYTYNEEALKLDPETDLEQEHIGPMAQDLEKVNPATVIVDPESGYRSVDTGRLALMNAGAIAELARRMEDLENGNV